MLHKDELIAKVNIYTNDPSQRGGVAYLNHALIQALPRNCAMYIYGFSSAKHFIQRVFRSNKFWGVKEETLAINFKGLVVQVKPIPLDGFWISTVGSPGLIPEKISPQFLWIATLIRDEPHSFDKRVLKKIEEREKRALLESKKRFAISPFTKKRIEEVYGVDVELLVPPLHDDVFLKRKTELRSKESCSFISAARFTDQRKNLPLLLEAFEKIRRNSDTLTIIGYPGKISIEGVRVFPELPRSDYLDLLRGSDVFIVSSKAEGLGIAALEAAQIGCWVASTPCGGLEHFLPGRGFVSKFHSSKDLSEVIEESRNCSIKSLPLPFNSEMEFSQFSKKIKDIFIHDFHFKEEVFNPPLPFV